MSEFKRAVFLKQSGELLESPDSDGHWGAASRVAAGIAEAYKAIDELNVSGLTIVTGAGNVARGETLRTQGIADKYADVVGRWGTLGNALVLMGALESLDLPVKPVIAASMDYEDATLGGHIDKYTPEVIAAAHAAGEVVVIAGGCGKDHVTTDAAVVFYASDFRNVSDQEIVILKSTKYDGVYESDPAKTDGHQPARYSKISAKTMQANYEKFKVVDQESLVDLVDSGLTMLIYSDAEHSLKEALDPKAAIGTLVVPQMCEAVVAS
jgi:uridylate kinase